MIDHDINDIPDYAASFAKLAAVLKIGRSQLHDIRLLAPRFPEITPSGWPVVKVGLLLELRRVEKLTPGQFAAERRESAGKTLVEIEEGRVTFGRRTPVLVAILKSIMQDFDGTDAHAEAVRDLSEALLRN